MCALRHRFKFSRQRKTCPVAEVQELRPLSRQQPCLAEHHPRPNKDVVATEPGSSTPHNLDLPLPGVRGRDPNPSLKPMLEMLREPKG